MYQALYRKWRPRVFEDVVGQEHITQTLRRQVETGRLSHAYLFTGTRGTGKTTCAKLLARAVNCERPEGGSPCNRCPSCLGIEKGSILDVLELDAASNNRVDDVRALLDEAAYTPAAVKKRVYIVDEVHMLSAQAFNALLQILEEPPAHLMFILATTEIHKVPATIKSRCQQFAFKRIRAGEIAARLTYVAEQEGLPLTAGGAALLARLADGGMRDALSLLDQCIGDNTAIGEGEILSALGLAGNVDTAALMAELAAGDAEGALTRLGRLYAGGKEMSALLGELSSLARDLLIRKTAPGAGASLMTGGFDSAVLRELSAALTVPRLVHMLTALQSALAGMARSANRRTDAELCLITLCRPEADPSPQALAARVDALERLADGGAMARRAAPAAKPVPEREAAPAPAEVPVDQPVEGSAQEEGPTYTDDPPPWAWDEEPAPRPAAKAAAPREVSSPRPAPPAVEPIPPARSGADWSALRPRLETTLSVADYCFLSNPDMVAGTIEGDTVTLWASSEMVKSLIDKPEILKGVSDAAAGLLGRSFRAVVRLGRPDVPAPEEAPPRPVEFDALDAFLAQQQGLGNITVTD